MSEEITKPKGEKMRTRMVLLTMVAAGLCAVPPSGTTGVQGHDSQSVAKQRINAPTSVEIAKQRINRPTTIG